jgi:hypothetical protein
MTGIAALPHSLGGCRAGAFVIQNEAERATRRNLGEDPEGKG